ncbi:plasmid maintenance system antidote protein VapI [Bradyrhizobium diazoefficiens]
MAKRIPRHVKISTAAVVAFGDRGHSKLAEAAGISRQMMSFIVNGDKPVTDDVYRRVAGALSKEADRMANAGRWLDNMSQQMLRELED